MSSGMKRPSRSAPKAGGALLAGSILSGALAGIVAGEPSIGFLAGLGLGLALLGAVWMLDRR